jgi:glycerol-3-phosphate dehydrogenase (NAD(P)+)
MRTKPKTAATKTAVVLGAGSWGTALAIQLARSGCEVTLWGRNPESIDELNRTRRNRRYLPDIELPPGLTGEAAIDTAIAGRDLVLIATPTFTFAPLLDRLAPQLAGRGLAWACKGFEPGSGRFLHELASERLGDEVPLAVLTGPSFASEVAHNLPTAVTVAGNDPEFTSAVARAFHAGSFRAYTSDDMIGAELGGAVKNVLAIGTGICDGLGLGNNARAALITRGLAEMMRLGKALGARPETLMGLAGIGDLVLTCTGDASRNRRLGLALGRGQTMSGAIDQIGQVVEGVAAALEVRRLAHQHDVKMPISEQVHGILHEGWNPEEGVRRLLAREQKPEHFPA